MERILCDGHTHHEKGELCHCCLSGYLSVITGSWNEDWLSEKLAARQKLQFYMFQLDFCCFSLTAVIEFVTDIIP